MRRILNTFKQFYKREKACGVIVGPPGILFGSALFLLLFAKIAYGGEVNRDADKTMSPYFEVDDKNIDLSGFPLKSTSVDVNITGVVANVEVRQEYHNTGTAPINAKYVFPGSTRAAVHDMVMTIGDRRVQAKVKEKEEARKTFERAKLEGKSASLLEQERPNVFSMNVANIMPGDLVVVELKYTEHLVPTDGTYEFVYPTVVGPRYPGGGDKGSALGKVGKWVANPYLSGGATTNDTFSIRTSLNSGMPLFEVNCISHKTDVAYRTKDHAVITLSVEETAAQNRDYIVHYRLADGKIASGLTLYEGHDENFFLLTVQPPKRVTKEIIPPREYVFVVDVSGSMNGFPLDTSKSLLRKLIGNLRPTDTFNVVLFAGVSSVMSNRSIPASQTNIERAISVIDNQRGGGGTELLSALKTAISMPQEESVSRNILIVTDGYISAEKNVFDYIDSHLGDANVFAFGIGSSVNRYLIEGIAKVGLGEPFVVTHPSESMKTAELLREYIESPVLTDVDVSFDGFVAYDVEPKYVPDLLAKRPLVIYGKWRNEAVGRITVTGTSGLGAYKQVIDVSKSVPKADNKVLRYLWARKKIERLSDYRQIENDQDAKSEVTNLGLKYNLLTEFTSFVAVLDQVRNPSAKAIDKTQPLPLPKGVSPLAISPQRTNPGYAVHGAPEPELYLLMIALSLLSLIAWYRRRRNQSAQDSGHN